MDVDMEIEEEEEERPISSQDLIEAVKKSMGTKLADMKALPQKRGVFIDTTEEINRKRPSSSTNSPSENAKKQPDSPKQTSRQAAHQSSSSSSSSGTYSSDMEERRDQITRKVITAIFGADNPLEYGPAEARSKDNSNRKRREEEALANTIDNRLKEKAAPPKAKPVEKEVLGVEDLNDSSDLDAVKKCIRQTRKKYDSIKKQIATLEKEKSLHKRNLIKLIELEKRIEQTRGVEYLSSSEED